MDDIRTIFWVILVSSVVALIFLFGCAFQNNYRHITAIGPMLAVIVGSSIKGLIQIRKNK